MGNDEKQKDEPNQELTMLKSQRSSMKRNIGMLKTKIEKDGDSLDNTILECRLQILESYFKQISHIQSQIEKMCPTDNARSDIEDTFVSAKAVILRRLNTHRRSSTIEQSILNTSAQSLSHHSRLPQLKLPKFDGKYSEFARFMSTYKTLVHEEASIPTIDKFNYLLNCLSGQALAVVDAFPVSEENYQKAVDRLNERYGNKSLIFIDTINSLFSINAITRPNAPSLRFILDNVSAIRSSLLSIGSEVDVVNAMLIHIVLSKIDQESKNAYNEKRDLKSLPSWDDCYNILSRRCQFLETSCSTVPQIHDRDKQPRYKDRRPGTSLMTSNALCEYCQSKDHGISSCSTYLALPVARRFDFVKSASLCINCLRKGHRVAKCTSKTKCRECRVSHHSSLHNPFSSNNTDQNVSSHPASHRLSSNVPSFTPSSSTSSTNKSTPPPTPCTSSQVPSTHITRKVALVNRSFRQSILPTAVVLMKDGLGIFQPVRALLDSCSEINLITQETADRLRLPKTNTMQEIEGVSEIRTKIKHSVTANVKSRSSSYEFTSRFLVIKSISSPQPSNRINISQWCIPEGVEFADPHFFVPQRIEVLIGSEVFFDLLIEGKIVLGEGLPVLTNTVLGWIVAGTIDTHVPSKVITCNVITKYDELNTLLKRFWEVEECQPHDSSMTEEEERCEAHYVNTTVFDEFNRVKVRLPFKETVSKLGASLEIAQRRFTYLEKRFLRDESLKNLYVDFMNEYSRLGHMTKVSWDNIDRPHYVIPHHSVLRPESTTTKLRVVFDASSRTSTNISLNEVLMVGPIIQQDLIITVLGFRLNKYALTADICKMYRQFLVDESDRSFQFILWRSDSNQPLELYQLNTVTYGTSAAPFLAVRSLSFIADSYKEIFPIGAHVLKQDVYVDDILTGAETISELLVKKEQIINILKTAGLELSKWNSNCDSMGIVNEGQICQLNKDYISKTLGMSWKSNSDRFCFRFELKTPHIVTKRSILSCVSRIFDILGLLSPIVVSMKILIQDIWKRNVDWDKPVDETIENRWLQIQESLPHINEIEIPRFVLTSVQYQFEIHGFADASLLAYGCCIYIRAPVENDFKVTLLIAKSKVAPVVQQSLPRLELCAALLLSRTWEKIRNKFDTYNYRVFFWSDSKIVLSWLSKHSSSFVCFVANRVSEIQNLTHNISWKHVSSKENPADVVSRGCLANELESTIWFTGPQFLSRPEREWPSGAKIFTELPSKEMRKSALKITTTTESIIESIITRSSSYLRILHVIVYVHRFIDRVKKNSYVTAEGLQIAFWTVVHHIQQTTYGEEIERIKSELDLKPHLQKLSPFIHEIEFRKQKRDILRVGGRLANSPLPFDAKFPALLPKDHRFSKLFVEYLHRKHYHAGAKCLIGILRQNVWIVNARDLVRKVVRNCIHCFKYKPKLQQQIMGDLPADRLNAHRPFLVSGVDFCGPFYTTFRIRGKAPYKTYVAIFVCFASKAVHIEVVSDLSTDTFLLALKRFIGRRGIPIRLYCDNATNFVGANSKLTDFRKRYLDSANIEALQKYSAMTGFQFSFIPPRSPHFGGLWEAAVKSTKSLLVKNISQANITLEELQTVLVEVEAILNSRPLAARSDDPNDGEALTPAHMLIGSSLLSVPDTHVEQYTNTNCLKRYQLITFLKQQFWKQWSRDYILDLQQKSKWYKTYPNIKEGTLVIVHEDNTPPQHWLLARVTKAIPGRDGKVRVVDLRTIKGIFRRSVQRVAPLPIGEDY
ncbi:uncharacterized protein LOC142233707 [Haematobia irritans]|uniref:uncharacterized protein LOC142233707 n=1 Tax=Haematobia irritans TaxID=7368 RepID=UPI003F4F496B